MEIGNGKAMKTGYYSRLEWPDPGGVMEQLHLVVEIFKVVKDEETRIALGK